MLDGISLSQIADHHCFDFKPKGILVSRDSLVKVPDYSWWPCARFFGNVLPVETSSSGLWIFLNNVDIFKTLVSKHIERRYVVEVEGSSPVPHQHIRNLKSAIPGAEIALHPIPISDSDTSLAFSRNSSFRFIVITRDQRQHVPRTLFGSIGRKLKSCCIESVGNLSLDKLNLKEPGSIREMTTEELLDTISSY